MRERRQEGLADAARADPGRLDRARGDRDARSSRSPGRAIVNSVNLEAGRDKLDRVVPMALAHGAALIALTIDEVGMAKTRRAQGRDRPAHPRPVLRRARPGPRAADLRLPDVHADDRRRGVAPVGGRDDRGHPRGSRPRSRGVKTSLGVSNVSFGVSPGARAVLNSRLPAPLRRGGAGPRDGQPEPHHALRRDPRARARAGRRPRLQPPRGRAASGSSRTSSPRARRTPPRRGRPDRGHGARGGAALPHPAPQQGGRRGLDRPQRREDRRGADAQRGAAAGDEGGRRQVRRRRADPAVRAAVAPR